MTGKRKSGPAAEAKKVKTAPAETEKPVIEEDFPRGGAVKTGSAPTGKKPQKKKAGAAAASAEDNDDFESTRQVGVLSFKHLSVGMTFLGAVRSVGELDVIVSLPNNLGILLSSRVEVFLLIPWRSWKHSGICSL